MAPVLLVGVTGGMGQPVLQGLAEGGLEATATAVLTRRTDSPAALALAQQGYTLVRGDLDDPASVAAALQGVRGVYVHALSKDAGEVPWVGGFRAGAGAQGARCAEARAASTTRREAQGARAPLSL